MMRLLLTLVLFFPIISFAGYTEREEVQAFIAEMQTRHGFDSERLTQLFAQADPIPFVLKAIAPPADPRIKSWRNYRQRFIEPKRLKAGLEFWRKHQATLAKAEALSGVPAEFIVAIIGIETIYGKHLGRFDTFTALATLAFDYPPRADLFRRELEALLLLARDEHRAPTDYRGSYAGAIGLPQFLPSSIRAYAVDFDGSGQIDLTGSPTDAIGSVANFFKLHGWESGGPVAVKVDVTERNPLSGTGETAHESLIAEGIKPVRRPAEMSDFGVLVPADAIDAPAALIDLVTPNAATEYWLGYQNFFVITRYNRSSFYAMAVFQFAQILQREISKSSRK
jgi:membrane-bound lytic murein transglycosylase B